jgi:hypothetical protein
MTKTSKTSGKLEKSEKPSRVYLIDDLLDAEVFVSSAQEILSPEVQELLDEF